MSRKSNLPALSRHITTTDDAGETVFISHLSPQPPSSTIMDGVKVSFCYGTEQFPVRLGEDRDIRSYKAMMQNPPGIEISAGTSLRIVDFPPGYNSAMHKTISVNFNIVIEGELELILDSGEKRIFRKGDSLIQRAANHSWRNMSPDTWARIVAMVLPTEL